MNAHTRPLPLLSARFVFDDHIRCMAAKQRLTKGRLKARQRKMQMIAHLLDLPASLIDVANSPQPSHTTVRSKSVLASGIPGMLSLSSLSNFMNNYQKFIINMYQFLD